MNSCFFIHKQAEWRYLERRCRIQLLFYHLPTLFTSFDKPAKLLSVTSFFHFCKFFVAILYTQPSQIKHKPIHKVGALAREPQPPCQRLPSLETFKQVSRRITSTKRVSTVRHPVLWLSQVFSIIDSKFWCCLVAICIHLGALSLHFVPVNNVGLLHQFTPRQAAAVHPLFTLIFHMHRGFCMKSQRGISNTSHLSKLFIN